jgi:hypothetical protein
MDCSALSAFLLFSQQFSQQFSNCVDEEHQYLDTHDDGPYILPDMTAPRVCFLSALITEMGHDLPDPLHEH